MLIDIPPLVINWPMFGQKVMREYRERPNVVEGLLQSFGASEINNRGDRIHSTCPVHKGDNGRGFVVYMDTFDVPVWNCFTKCRAAGHGKGNLVTLVQKCMNLRFHEAITYLAQHIGIPVNGQVITIPQEELQDKILDDLKRKHDLLNRKSPNIFPEQMATQSAEMLRRPECSEIFNYLTGPTNELARWGEYKRNVPVEVLNYFQVGFVLGNQWVWAEPDIRNPQASRRVGWFESRISVPWRDSKASLMGFSGRRIDGIKDRKYQDLHGTYKQFSLYGLHSPLTREAIAKTGTLHMVEGYADVWRGWAYGVHNIVAVGGTGLSPFQCDLIAQCNPAHVNWFADGDDAGRIAAIGACEKLKDTYRVSISHPPDKKDPDDLSREHFHHCLNNAHPFSPRSQS